MIIAKNLYSVFEFTFGPAVVDTQLAVVYADIQLVAHQQDDATEVDPQHEQQHGADGAVEQVIAAEVVDIDAKTPGEQEEHAGGEDGTRREEAHTLLLDGCPVVDDGDGREGGEDKQQPPDGMEEYGTESRHRDDVVDEEVPHDVLVSEKEAEHQHNEEVHDEHQTDADEKTLHEGALLDAVVGEVQRDDEAVHAVGCQDDGGNEAYGEERRVLMSHNVVDGVADGTHDFFGYDASEAVKQLVLNAVDGEVCDEGEEENHQRRQGGDEGVGQAFGAVGER